MDAKDPVCGMTIDQSAAAGMSVYGGQMYFFCSTRCKEQFDEQPASFASNADSDYMRGGKGRRDEVGPTGIYPAGSPDVPPDARVVEPGEFVHHAGGRRAKQE